MLFMASVMLPLFLPGDVTIDKLARALVGVALFSAAYLAEVVRGGLQAIPRGQYEAAAALGLGYARTMGLIILPQALKIVIPGIVNSFIALFKDTSLVLIIGLFDLLGIVQQSIQADSRWFLADDGGDELRVRRGGVLGLLLRHVALRGVHRAAARGRGAADEPHPRRPLPLVGEGRGKDPNADSLAALLCQTSNLGAPLNPSPQGGGTAQRKNTHVTSRKHGTRQATDHSM